MGRPSSQGGEFLASIDKQVLRSIFACSLMDAMRGYRPLWGFRARALGLVFVAAFGTVRAEPSAPSDSAAQTPDRGSRPYLGVALLAGEYVGGPIVAFYYWWRNTLQISPFTNIREGEHYFQDKAWHIWAGEILSDLHYSVLKNCFGIDSPWPSIGLSLLTLTAAEVVDASDSKGGLSVWDLSANLAGIGFWWLKHRHPQVPLDVRVGIRRWDQLGTLLTRLYEAPSDFEGYQRTRVDTYSILKAELIVRPYGCFYLGGACSLRDVDGWGVPENLWGVTVGFDLLRFWAARYPDFFNPLLKDLTRYTSCSVAYTHWLDRL